MDYCGSFALLLAYQSLAGRQYDTCICSQWSDEYNSGSESAQDELPDQVMLRAASDTAQAAAADMGGANNHLSTRSDLMS